jgi:hypothetical protein
MADDGEHYRRAVPQAPTDTERLELKREDAGFAFELNQPPIKRSRLGHFGLGMGHVEGPDVG